MDIYDMWYWGTVAVETRCSPFMHSDGGAHLDPLLDGSVSVLALDICFDRRLHVIRALGSLCLSGDFSPLYHVDLHLFWSDYVFCYSSHDRLPHHRFRRPLDQDPHTS